MVQYDRVPLLRAVIYVVQFEVDPTRAVDRVLTQVIEQGALGTTRRTEPRWRRLWRVTMRSLPLSRSRIRKRPFARL